MMTAAQKIKREILSYAMEDEPSLRGLKIDITDGNIDDLYEKLLVEKGLHSDYEYDFRISGIDTPEMMESYNHNYESKGVAAILFTGEWVGWTFWFGGGKYGDPEEIPWMEEAYDLNCVEKEELIITRQFSLKESDENHQD